MKTVAAVMVSVLAYVVGLMLAAIVCAYLAGGLW